MSDIEQAKTAIEGLWLTEARQIHDLRRDRNEEADRLRRTWEEGHRAHVEARGLLEQAESLLIEHSRALLGDDDELADEIKAKHRALEDRAADLLEESDTALSSLADAGIATGL